MEVLGFIKVQTTFKYFACFEVLKLFDVFRFNNKDDNNNNYNWVDTFLAEHSGRVLIEFVYL